MVRQKATYHYEIKICCDDPVEVAKYGHWLTVEYDKEGNPYACLIVEDHYHYGMTFCPGCGKKFRFTRVKDAPKEYD